MTFFISDALASDTTQSTQLDLAGSPDMSADKMMLDNLLLLSALFFIFYFILLRPQQQRLKAHKELIKSLQKGQKVITNGGLIGEIAKLEGDHVLVLEIAQGVKVKVARSSVSELYKTEASSGANANDN